jgi:hypothetical protein
VHASAGSDTCDHEYTGSILSANCSHEAELLVDGLAQEVGCSGRDALADALDPALERPGDDRAPSEELHETELLDEARIRFRTPRAGLPRKGSSVEASTWKSSGVTR